MALVLWFTSACASPTATGEEEDVDRSHRAVGTWKNLEPHLVWAGTLDVTYECVGDPDVNDYIADQEASCLVGDDGIPTGNEFTYEIYGETPDGVFVDCELDQFLVETNCF